MPTRALLVVAGTPDPALVAKAGPYVSWFEGSAPGLDIVWTPVLAYQGEPVPAVDGFDAVVMTGSPLSVTQLEPWMEPAGRALLAAAESGKPVLGVCFGHQLLGRVLGGEVLKNPVGREIGTVTVKLTEAGKRDPLFEGLPEELAVHATHEDAVTSLPAGATLLAGNGYGVHAFRAGPRCWGVQFHPELDETRLGHLIASREAVLTREGRFHAARESLRPSKHGNQVMTNFFRQAGKAAT
jgi:GMP synthase (glutamine-hydrolysing)